MIPSFHSPHLLWLLVPLMLLFSWELARHTTRSVADWPKIARAWAGSFHVSLGTQHTTAETRPRIWLWFGLACCIIALARPQWGVIEEQVFDQSREVIIAIDLSKSMLAQDVKPSRLERSKLLTTALLDGLKGERVGLVLFAGTAFLQSPLSSDYEVLREFLPALRPDYLPEGGSDYKAMLETSIQAFGTSAADRYLIVLSDGESTDEEWKSLTESLKTKGIRVIGLGVGTAQGSFIPDSSGGFIKDDRGAVVLSRLNSSTLQELAQTTSGAYADASTWVDLPALLKQTVEAGKKGDFSEKNTARKVERFQWFLAPGLLLLFISFWAEFPVRPRERALPLGRSGVRKTEDRVQSTENRARKTAAASVASALCILSSVLCSPSAVRAAETTESPSETLAKPLSTTVARLSVKDDINPKDCAELAQTTITYGQRLKTSQQQAPEGVIRDGLAAVDLGEKQDPKAADWPKLRKELEDLLKKPEEQQKKDQNKQDQNKQQQQQNQQNQNQDPQQNQKDQQDQQQQQQSQQSDQQKQQQQQQKQNQSAFGDMGEPQEKKGEPQKQPPQPPAGTQKVGGQNGKKQEIPVDPELTVPLQKLDQVRNQDSPAKLQQIMQGQQKQPPKKGKDW